MDDNLCVPKTQVFPESSSGFSMDLLQTMRQGVLVNWDFWLFRAGALSKGETGT
jgi:hypothetical protein